MAEALKSRLSKKEILIAPGAFDALTARLIEASGFEAVYLSGAGVSYSVLAKPDIGLVTREELTDRVKSAAKAVSVPLIADGDTGFGDAIEVKRTVELCEKAGAAAIQLEDQCFPKRCGHLEGKKLVSSDEMVEKIEAALNARASDEFLIIARTDARSVEGIEEAVIRGRRYIEAGADALFVESPQSRAELEEIAAAFSGTPLIANMVEGGKTPLIPARDLEEMGYSLVIYPNSLTRSFAKAGLDLLRELKEKGTTIGYAKKMMLFRELNEFFGIDRSLLK